MLVELAGYPVFNDLLEIPRYEEHFMTVRSAQNWLITHSLDE